MGIEPTSEAWEASILPLYDARSSFNILLRIDLAHAGSSDRSDPRRVAQTIPSALCELYK
jgi:hypothetical protein